MTSKYHSYLQVKSLNFLVDQDLRVKLADLGEVCAYNMCMYIFLCFFYDNAMS